MNEFERITDAELDRLVDGEMSLAEQRAMLSRLEHESDGWRRLALAFLEGQVLAQVCPGLLTDGPAWSASKPATVALPRARRAWRETLIAVSAVAAAFLLGVWSQHGGESKQPTQSAAKNKSPAVQEMFKPRVDRMSVIFPEGSGQWSAPVMLPVVDGSDARVQPWLKEESVLPVAVRNALREAGRHVSEQRQWMEVDLEDGRRGYVPVSELVVSADEPWQYP